MALAISARVSNKRLPNCLQPRSPGTRFSSSESSSIPIHSLPSSPSTRYASVTHPESPASVSPAVQATIDHAAQFLLPVYARPPFMLARGRGANVWDTEGRKYLDFSAGIAVNALGHADPEFTQRMTEEAGTLLHASNLYYNQWAGKLAELLVTLTQREGGLGWSAGALPPPGLSSPLTPSSPSPGAKVFFANSGTEANEGALKIARKVGKERWARTQKNRAWSPEDGGACGKWKFACFENGFHGRSIGALSATSNPKYQTPFAPLVPGFEVGRLNDTGALERLVTDETCGVIVEPIQGEGGINVADVEWLKALRRRCDEVGAVLIFDEIQCGLYRTGTMWAHSALPAECHPDIVTMAKPLANGYPIGAVLIRDNVAKTMTAGTHGTTFGGSPLACALGHHVLTRLSERAFVASMVDTSAYLMRRLSLLPKWFPEVVGASIRGRGLILGIPFRDTSHPSRLVGMARERGVLILSAGKDAVRLVPSLNIGREEVDVAVDVIESCLGLMQKP